MPSKGPPGCAGRARNGPHRPGLGLGNSRLLPLQLRGGDGASRHQLAHVPQLASLVRTLALCSASSACCLPRIQGDQGLPCLTCWPELTAMVAMRLVTSGLMATERLAASLLTSLMEGSARLCLTVSALILISWCWLAGGFSLPQMPGARRQQ